MIATCGYLQESTGCLETIPRQPVLRYRLESYIFNVLLELPVDLVAAPTTSTELRDAMSDVLAEHQCFRVSKRCPPAYSSSRHIN